MSAKHSFPTDEVLARREKSAFDGGFQAGLDYGCEVRAELLEALKDCVQWLTGFAKGTGNEIICETERYKKYTDAIARAEGGQSCR